MKLLIQAFVNSPPVLFRNTILQKLFAATAEAFDCSIPRMDRIPYHERLRAYAEFTSGKATKVIQEKLDLESVKTRLFQGIYPLGEKLRKWLGIEKMDEVLKVGHFLYKAIEIDLQGGNEGEVTVSRCYFSQHYSAPVCDLISALDDGLFSGLSGGGRLIFSQRITECQQCCKARLLFNQEACA